MNEDANLRSQLIAIALQWQDRYGVAPHITSAITEIDAAKLVGMSEGDYCAGGTHRTAVTKGYDFKFGAYRYQVKANRPSGKPGSPVRLVAKAHNYDWDRLVWMLYDRTYNLQEAWEWNVDEYKSAFGSAPQKSLRPKDMRGGRQLFPAYTPNAEP